MYIPSASWLLASLGAFLPAMARWPFADRYWSRGWCAVGGIDNGSHALNGGSLRVTKHMAVASRGWRITGAQQCADQRQRGASANELASKRMSQIMDNHRTASASLRLLRLWLRWPAALRSGDAIGHRSALPDHGAGARWGFSHWCLRRGLMILRSRPTDCTRWGFAFQGLLG